ncbi:MAG: S-adenosylmethionine decarboxylase [Gemmatimonadota bacterium]|nr:S-adenosylmethionine decarboxylase [Gemmatimonadota bacterium]
MSAAFERRAVELSGIAPERLDDPAALAALTIAAAVACGISAEGAPAMRAGIAGVAVGVIGVDGHVVLHTAPADGTCLVDVVVREPRQPDRALDVIARRLGAYPAASEP